MPRKCYQASLAAKEERRTSRKQFVLPSTLFLPQVAMQSPGISSPSPRAEAICSEQELNIFFFFPLEDTYILSALLSSGLSCTISGG